MAKWRFWTILRAQQPVQKNIFLQNGQMPEVQKLLRICRSTKKYSSGQVIISEFEPGESFYLIQKGTVQLVKCVNGQNKNLDILKPGEFFGEMAILDNSPRSATCLAVGNVQCLEFNKSNFELLITGNPQIALNILKLFCKRIYDQKRLICSQLLDLKT